ncbi:MAG TPA: FAD-dependent oxidoreductase [Actinomycetota bacterium]|nr:FAD-dependent oxidoreductase [Actinomycetota bacterium]
MRKRAVVVGSGAGGATVARELQGAFDVTVVEAGREFQRATLERRSIERMRRSRLLVDPRLVRLVYPPIRFRRTPDMLLVNGIGTGGTTTMATGNGIRMDGDLRALGLDLDREFDEIAREIPITTAHRGRWHPTTRRLFRAFEDLGLGPVVLPKMGDAELCRHCGRCMLGCPYGRKWDSRAYLDEAVRRGARLMTGSAVTEVVIEDGRATGVVTRTKALHRFVPADLVVLAAGGFGTPAILERSGIGCEPTLFVDPVLTVAARVPNAWQCNEIEMPFVVQREGYILAPYFDWISSLFHPSWRHRLQDIVGIMIKLADESVGSVSGGKVHKLLTPADRSRLDEAVDVATEILAGFGADPHAVFLGTVHAGHPGGMLPLTEASAPTMHDDRLPENAYVADATLFPRSLGNPPILTIIAMAKRIAAICAGEFAPSHLPAPQH